MQDKEKRILVIEDEAHIAHGLNLCLSKVGYEVSIAVNGIEGLNQWRIFKPHLIILDIMMPELDGWATLQEIRKEDSTIPIIITSAKDQSKDKIKSLSLGSDDYLTKPFNLDELLLRIEGHLKKYFIIKSKQVDSNTSNDLTSEKLCFGDNVVDLTTGESKTPRGQIKLTLQELKLLQYFYTNKDKIISRNEILENCWGYNVGEELNTRTVDIFVSRLRKYFELDAKSPKYILSIRSQGYKFVY